MFVSSKEGGIRASVDEYIQRDEYYMKKCGWDWYNTEYANINGTKNSQETEMGRKTTV